MKKLEQGFGAGAPLVRTPSHLLIAVVAVLLLAGACGQPQTPPATSTTTPVTAPAATSTTSPEETSTTTTPITAPANTSTASPEATAVSDPEPAQTSSTQPSSTTRVERAESDGGLLTLLGGLVVEAEQPDGYDRGLFRHWVDADGDGCDTRREVLITEAVTAPTVGGGCGLSDGVWVSRYDGETETGTGRGFDIDHLVPLKEAWDSGAHGWDAQTRERFANDLGYEHSLVAVSAGSNRSKGAQDPTGWLPPERSQRCWYAAAWINVKARWDLSVDPAEADTLRNILSGCSDNAADTALPAPVVTGAQSATAAAEATGSEDEGCHPDYSPCIPHLGGDALNCGDLAAAQKPVTVRVPGVDPYQLDRDGDGRGCTS